MSFPDFPLSPLPSNPDRLADVLSTLAVRSTKQPTQYDRLSGLRRYAAGHDKREQARKDLQSLDNGTRLLYPSNFGSFCLAIDAICQLQLNPQTTPTFDINRGYKEYQKIVGTNPNVPLLSDREIFRRALGNNAEKYSSILDTHLPEHSLTGAQSAFEVGNAVAIARERSFVLGVDRSLIFSDISNVGGTNQFFERLLLANLKERLRSNEENIFDHEIWQSLGINTEGINESVKQNSETFLEALVGEVVKSAAKRLTDWSVRAMLATIKQVAEEVYGDKATEFSWHGIGGDELYLITPELKEAEKEKRNIFIQKVKAAIQEFIQMMELNDYKHKKADKADKKGLNIEMVAASLSREHFSLEEMTAKSDSPTKAASGNPIAPENISTKRLKKLVTNLSTHYKNQYPKAVSEIDPELMYIDAENKLPTADPIGKTLRALLLHPKHQSIKVEDIIALPSYIKKGFLKLDDSFKLYGINIENIAAINDHISQSDADTILAGFAEKLKRVLPEGSRVFIYGPGKFICATNTELDKGSIDKEVTDLIQQLNEQKPKGHNITIGELRSKTNPNLQGLFHATDLRTYDQQVPLKKMIIKLKIDLEQSIVEQTMMRTLDSCAT